MTTSGMHSIIEATFNGMIGTGNDELFAQGITDGCVDCISTVIVNAASQAGTDSGPSGSFTGEATGTMQVVPMACQQRIYNATKDMIGGNKGDDWLAKEIAGAIDDMCTAATFTITITGNTVVPSSGPVPSTDSGIGTYSSNPTIIESALNALFGKMSTWDNGSVDAGDNDFIDVLCGSFEDYLKAAQVSIVGASHLAGTSGIGTIS